MILPLALTNSAPNALKIAPMLSLNPGLGRPIPNGYPAFAQASAALRDPHNPFGSVQGISGVARVELLNIDGEIPLHQADPRTAGLVGRRIGPGTAIHWFSALASTPDGIVLPVGSQIVHGFVHWLEAVRILKHVPLEEWDEIVTDLGLRLCRRGQRQLVPLEVMKSAFTSTLSLSAQVITCLHHLSPAGTQDPKPTLNSSGRPGGADMHQREGGCRSPQS